MTTVEGYLRQHTVPTVAELLQSEPMPAKTPVYNTFGPADAIRWRSDLSRLYEKAGDEILGRSGDPTLDKDIQEADQDLYRYMFNRLEIFDFVLWKHDLWTAARQGHEALMGTEVQTEETASLTPQIWMFEDFSTELGGVEPRAFRATFGGLKIEAIFALPVRIAAEGVMTKDQKKLFGGDVLIFDSESPMVPDDMQEGLRMVANKAEPAVTWVAMLMDTEPKTLFDALPIFRTLGTLRPSTGVQHEQLTGIWAAYLFSRMSVSERTRESLPRPLRRRVAEKSRVPEFYRITLRRAKHEASVPGSAEASRDWTCQWIVQGHWRKQWHPSTGTHRAKFIHAYVKGPDGLPLRQPRQRIYEVVK